MKPPSKFDSVHAELNSEREREKELTAKLKEAQTELRRLNREYKTSERQRDSLEHRYDSILRSRFWRYTLPARRLVDEIRRVFRPQTGKVGQVEHVEPVAKRDTSGRATNKSRDLGQGATEQGADNSRNLRQRKTKTEKVQAIDAGENPRYVDDKYDIVFFWKQNDTGIYGRRQDMIVKHLSESLKVNRIVHFDAPIEAAALHSLLDLSEEGKISQDNLIFSQTVSRLLGLEHSEKIKYYTFVYAAKSSPVGLMPQPLPKRKGYLDYLKNVLRENGLGHRKTIFWVCPVDFHFPDIALAFDPDLIVADVIDDNRDWNDPGSDQFEKRSRNYEEILGISELVLTNCQPLKQAMLAYADEIHVIPNAAELPEADETRQARPEELKRMKGPILGYVGKLSSKRINIDLLEYVALTRPEWNIVLIGSAHSSKDILKLDAYNNVHFLGVKRYQEAQRYIANFDVALIPHVDNRMTQSRNPLKLFVYVSMGVPVVSTEIENLDELRKLIYVARDKGDFVEKVELALEQGRSPEPSKEHLDLLRENSWDVRVEKMLVLIDEKFDKEPHSASEQPSLVAELNFEREREKGLAAKLEEAETELRRLNREYETSERRRASLEHRYDSILQSRFWRYTLPARRLVDTIRYVFRPQTGRVGQVELVEPVAKRNTPGQATDKGRDLGQGATEQGADNGRNLRQRKTKTEKIKADNGKNLRQHRPKVHELKNRLYALGFTERALEDLQNLVTDSSEPTLQSRAAWQLSLWHTDQCSEEGARKCLELLPVALKDENDPVRLRQAAVVEAECQEALGNTEAARLAISRALELGPHADLFLARANLEAPASARMEWVNKALELHGIPEISFDASAGRPLLDSLRPGQDEQERVEVSSDTKVSVIVPVYNAEDVIRTALDSVLSQTWTNLEVLVVDDCSTDATVPIVEDYVRRDPRVQLIRAKTNGGPYIARNLALSAATGALVTCHDADDWSHPEKIERQARHLLGNPLVVGNTSQQARATSDLRFYRRGNPGFYIFGNFSSFMFRRELVMDAVGYWDCVRFAGDGEFIQRVKKVFGDESMVNEPTGPLSFVRQSSSSLTGCEPFGYRGVNRGIRKEYFESRTHFHDTAESLRYEFPLDVRPFPVPEPMWPTREVKRTQRRHFDVILVSDFRLFGGITLSNVEEIKAQKRMGLRTGLIQMYRYDLDHKTINPKVRELLDGDRVQMLVYGEKVSCDVLILRYPPILQEWQQFVPDVGAANVHVIVNQTPLAHYGYEGELRYTISRCAEHLQKYFGKAGVWYPNGPLVREALYQHHAEESAEIMLASEDWSNIIDVNEWRRESRPPRGPRSRIGRHSKDNYVKWPIDASELLAVYPDSDDYEVHVLGGAEAPRKVLGGLPKNWHVLGFGEVHLKDFLSTLDVFVYYTHPDLVEASGRTIIEAVAVGVPVILPHSYRELFKEAAVYAEPSEVKRSIDQLMIDDDYYESQVRLARDYVEEHFGYTLHASRLRKRIGRQALEG